MVTEHAFMNKSYTSKIYTYIDNKELELIPLSHNFNLPEVVFRLPNKLKNNDNNLTITYQLGKTIRNKMLNYKEAVNSIYLDDDVSFCLITDQNDCAKSSLCDPQHKHIITGNLQISKNNKLRILLTKGPNYREIRTMKFSKVLTKITSALDTYIKAMTLKTKYTITSQTLNHGQRKF